MVDHNRSGPPHSFPELNLDIDLSPARLEEMRQEGLRATPEEAQPTTGAYYFTAALLGAGQTNTFPDLRLNALQLNAFVERLIADRKEVIPQWGDALNSLALQAAEVRLRMAGVEDDQIAIMSGAASYNVVRVRRSLLAKNIRMQYPNKVDDVRQIFSAFLQRPQQRAWRRQFPRI